MQHIIIIFVILDEINYLLKKDTNKKKIEK